MKGKLGTILSLTLLAALGGACTSESARSPIVTSSKAIAIEDPELARCIQEREEALAYDESPTPITRFFDGTGSWAEIITYIEAGDSVEWSPEKKLIFGIEAYSAVPGLFK